MRIAINTRLIIPGKMDGIGWFSFETVSRMVKDHPEHEFFLLYDRKPSRELIQGKNVTPVVLFPPARHPVLWHLFFNLAVTRALRKLRINLFLSPDGWTSLRTSVPTLTVIHDLNFEHSQDYLRPSHQRYMKHFFPLFAQKARRIATVSEFSRQDIISTYHIPPSKVDVVYNGASTHYKPLPAALQQETRNTFSQGNPYFLFVGTISKRKNLTNMLLAFDRFKNTDSLNTKFLVVGARFWWKDELEQAYENMLHKDSVIFLGRVEPESLSRIVASSLALMYVSLFEGFGIPVIEAFHAETPVITSNNTSLPEVAGDAALMVDPLSVEDIASAMQSIAQNPSLREDLIARGRIQRTRFSWEITAGKLWNSLMKTIES